MASLSSRQVCQSAATSVRARSTVPVLKIASARIHVRVASGEENAQQSTASSDQKAVIEKPEIPEAAKLTTWQYGKTKDPDLVPFYMFTMFLIPVLLIVLPLIANFGATPPPASYIQ